MSTQRTEHIHMLGICGTGMGSLAILLKDADYKVTGSDENVYPPMSTQLESNGIKVLSGYKPENLNFEGNRPDLVIIGNVISRGNPEAEAVLASGIKYLSMAQAVAELFIKDKYSIVVAGTHGKTSTSTLCAWLLECANTPPSFLIGGVGNNFKTSAKMGTSNYFVIEGDEYDTAFFDKGPKFLHYRPQGLVLTPVEFDHADIYKDLSAVLASFEKLINIMPENGIISACADSANVKGLIASARCKVVTYGINDGADYVPKNISPTKDGTSFDLYHKGSLLFSFTAPFYGNHNIQNATGVIAILHQLGINMSLVAAGLTKFNGVKRRQEVRGVARGITVIDDFAHHPTAIRETIAATRFRYPDSKIIALFEPRSNTSRRNIFQKEFAAAFKGADHVIIAGVHRADKLKDFEKLDVAELIDDINKNNVPALTFVNTDEIVEHVKKIARPGDVVLVMSNGGFDNIHERLISKINTNG